MPFDIGRRVLQAGTGKGRAGKGGVLAVSVTPVGNVGAGIDDLISMTLPANTLYKNGQGIRIRAWGTYAANGASKQVILVFGGTNIVDMLAVVQNNTFWRLEATIHRVSAGNQDCSGHFNHSTVSGTTFVATTKNEATDLIIKVTGESVSNNDIVQRGMFIEVLAAP